MNRHLFTLHDSDAPLEGRVLEETPEAIRIRTTSGRSKWINRLEIIQQSLLKDLTPDEELIEGALLKLSSQKLSPEEARAVVEEMDRLRAVVARYSAIDEEMFPK